MRINRDRRRSIVLILVGIAPITTGMCSCQVSRRVRFMLIAPMDRSCRNRVFASIEKDSTRSLWTRCSCSRSLRPPRCDRPGNNASVAMKSVVADPDLYDWEGDQPLKRPFAETVIYELHVRGFTRHPSSGVAADKSGTYAGLIEKDSLSQGSGNHGSRAFARFSSSTPRMRQPVARTTGVTSRCPFSRRITHTVRARNRSTYSMNFVTWSRRSTALESK